MPWNVIISVLLIVGLVIAIVYIKRQQDAPLRSFAEALDAALQGLRQKPDATYVTPLGSDAKEVPFDSEKQSAGFGEFRLVFDEDLTIQYKHERTAEFVDLLGGGMTQVGIQYIEANPTEIYLDDERVPEPRRFLEEYTGDMMSLRRLIRKHLRLPQSDKQIG